MNKRKITYKSSNGYAGRIDGACALTIYNPEGIICLHSYRSNVKEYDELVEVVDGMAEFMDMLDDLGRNR